MSLKQIKILYEIEQKRVNGKIIGILFAIMFAVILSITLFKPFLSGYTVENATVEYTAISFMYFMTVFFGTTFSLLALQEIRTDYTRGVYYTFLTYPVKPGDIIIAKVMAVSTYVLVDTSISFFMYVILTEAFFIYKLEIIIGIFAGLLLLIFSIMAISFILSPLSELSPLPEMIVLGLFFGITLFSYSIPSEYIALFAPYLTVVKAAYGLSIPLKEIAFSILSPLCYLTLAYGSYFFLNTYKRREIK